ncbi:hypothetical protein DM02DRAFT_666754 [Periconia macrospinosa]|uniref:DUF6536 domain-containing protein n=1 Tax=Periconia macrospinosa TaxID=97972 RepID=A0A2V1EDJ6_9PLEO|nr:hypothetical protein DM02DRAFT_666754 [Periconia macrospinosa]
MAHVFKRIKEWFIRKGQPNIQQFIQLRLIGRLPTDLSSKSDITTFEGDNAEFEARLERSKHFFTFPYSLLRSTKVISSAWNDRFPGWRGGIAGFAIFTSVILILNVSILVWAATHMDDGYYATLAVGDWEYISNISGWLHLGINILSAGLLAGSNYCMQCLTSPTRNEIDAAHARDSYLNIGILSWRNVRAARKRRLCLLSFLTLTSVFMHAVYDTSFITTAALYGHIQATITPQFVYEEELTFADLLHHSYGVEQDVISKGFQDNDNYRYIQHITTDRKLFVKPLWENISASECIDYQRQSFHIDRSAILLVTNETVDPSVPKFNYLWVGGEARPVYMSPTTRHEEIYRIRGGILYCLTRKEAGRNRLQIHFWLFLATTLLTSIKLFCLLYTWKEQQETPIVTTGDAIASFLESSCENSAGMCLLSQEEVIRELELTRDDPTSTAMPTFKVFQAIQLRYNHSVSFSRQVIYISLFALTILLSGYGFNVTKTYFRKIFIDNDLRSLWSMGLGKLHSHSVTTSTLCDPIYSRFPFPDNGWRRCTANFGDASVVVSGNIPSLAVSGIYLCLNYQLTLMVQLRDWTRFASRRQALRVSNPEPDSDQISTYWLSLPHRYSIPLLLASASWGWLVSQTLFILRYEIYDEILLELHPTFGSVHEKSLALGFSAIGIVYSIGFGLIIFCVSVAIGFCKCAPGMPLGPSNSLVIAAACHPPERDRHAARKLVKWGAIPEGSAESNNMLHHCTITSQRVEYPVEGRWYK